MAKILSSSTIIKVIPDKIPLWRTNMVKTDTLYYVSSNIPGMTAGLTLPLPSHFGQGELGSYGPGWDVMSGYSSGTLLEDVGGPFGTMVYGTGGHTRLQNQLLGLDLNRDEPAFFWWQQPSFKNSNSGNADLYYNPTEAAALAAGPRGLAATIPTSGESGAGWDKTFPVAFDGWIFPKKLVTGQLGDNVPHGFRYSSVCFVPASVTGGDSLFFACLGPQGPFAQSFMPSEGVSLDQWIDPAALSANIRRRAFYFKNTRTGQWFEHKWQPHYSIYGFVQQCCGFFRDLRRVYISGDESNGTAVWWYIDMNSGYPNFSVSELVRPTTPVSPNRYASGAWTDGHPDGKHLVYFPDLQNPKGLVVQDFDSNKQYRLDLSGANFEIPNSTEMVGMSYDSSKNRILILLKESTNELYYFSLRLPANVENAAGYAVTRTTVQANESAMTSLLPLAAHFYGKTRIHPSLGVILVPISQGRMLGFVPS